MKSFNHSKAGYVLTGLAVYCFVSAFLPNSVWGTETFPPWSYRGYGGDMNDSGQIVGLAQNWDADYPHYGRSHAFLLEDGEMKNLGTFGGFWSGAHAINNSGQVVGKASTNETMEDTRLEGSISHAFLWQNDEMTDLGTLGGLESYANDINDAGKVVGWSTADPERAPFTGPHRAFLWENGQMIDLGTLGGSHAEAHGINNSGQVVGYSTTADGQSNAFLWQDGEMTDLGSPDGRVSIAYDINDAGQVVGYGYGRTFDSISDDIRDGTFDPYSFDPPPHALLWENGKMTDLGTLGGNWSKAYAINNSGQVVGASGTADGQTHAFLWQNDEMTDLGSLGDSSQAAAINDTGQIMGSAVVSLPCGYDEHIILWENGNMTDLTPDGPTGPFAKEERECNPPGVVDFFPLGLPCLPIGILLIGCLAMAFFFISSTHKVR